MAGAYARREFLVLDLGADPSGAQPSDYAVQAAINSVAANGGPLFLPPGLLTFENELIVPNNVAIIGCGRGVTTARAVAGQAAVFKRVASSSSDTVEHIGFSEFTLDGKAGPTGTTDGIWVDTSVSEACTIRDVLVDGVEFLNCRIGNRVDGNNSNGGPMLNQTGVERSIFRNCAFGDLATGTYAHAVTGNQFFACTGAAVGTGGVTPGAPTVTGTGPAALTKVTGCHIEGLGNLSGSGSAQEHGIYIGATEGLVADCIVQNVSRFACSLASNEGMSSSVHGIVVYGSGWSGLYMSGPSGFGTVSDCSLYAVSQATTGADTQAQCAILHGTGSWNFTDIQIPTASDAPPYAFGIAGDSAAAFHLEATRVNCPSPTSGWAYAFNNPAGALGRFTDCQGLNPLTVDVFSGQPVTPAVPAASTTVTNTTGADMDIYIAGGTAVAVSVNGIATGLAAGSFFVPAGGTINLGAYTAAPTWKWVGR